MHGTWTLRLRQSKSIAHESGNITGVQNLTRGFGERPHHRNCVNDLKSSLTAAPDRLLARNYQHRHTAERGVGSSGDQIGSTWTESAETYARHAGKPAISGRHKASGLLVSGNHQADGRRP